MAPDSEELPGDWMQYRRLILSELKRISADMESVAEKFDLFRREEVSQIKVDIAMLKVKAGVWGLGGGLLVALGGLLLDKAGQ